MPAPKKRSTRAVRSIRRDDEPMVVHFKTRAEPAEVETEPLFYIDDVEYRIPVKLPVNLGLRYLRLIRQQGRDLAADWLLEQVLSEEGYEALANQDFDDDEEQFEHLFQIIERRALGQKEGAAGNRRSG
ncbi:hypothetical protein Aph01nite_43840 [Acrocarpospora phusangensis]|uniref:Uncharacterized protein n=1 Tax=Acrocarpospora phusangensis TaxID=1070424 RepID=A0A919ULK4_9ACTN|nr:hypothetical protein [Acrocarpospora phusangensis]GIH26074.1 hypothetical protein Aph01nite_43840 [Acrocarpospora phusangensis]